MLLAQTQETVGRVLESTNGRSDGTYLVVIVLIFCALMLIVAGYFFFKLQHTWQGILSDQRGEFQSMLSSVSSDFVSELREHRTEMKEMREVTLATRSSQVELVQAIKQLDLTIRNQSHPNHSS